MKAKLQKGKLVVELSLEDAKPSASGKSMVIASSHGVRRTAVRIDGKSVCIVVSAFVRSDNEQQVSEKAVGARRIQK